MCICLSKEFESARIMKTMPPDGTKVFLNHLGTDKAVPHYLFSDCTQ
jgi:hypothetical protein